VLDFVYSALIVSTR